MGIAAGWILLSLGAFIIVGNWFLIIRAMAKRKSESAVPFVGGLLVVVAWKPEARGPS